MTDRDELLRRIGERVVERATGEGFTEENCAACPACGRSEQFALAHQEGCPIAKYLGADTLGIDERDEKCICGSPLNPNGQVVGCPIHGKPESETI